MGGILKNSIPEEESPNPEGESVSQFRQKVLKNTQLNAKLTSNSKLPHHTHGIPKDTLSMKLQDSDPDRLKWNKQNLEENEITKQQFDDIHIDEPKTPYQGAVDPSGEYYKVDDEEEEDLGSFTLGEPEVELKEDTEPVTLLETSEDLPLEEDEDDEATAKHKKFEEMRKKHYNIREALKAKPDAEDDEYEEDQEGN